MSKELSFKSLQNVPMIDRESFFVNHSQIQYITVERRLNIWNLFITKPEALQQRNSQ